MNREEELLKKRLLDLANLADRRGIATFSDFLNLNELNIFHGLQRELSFIQCRPFGGYESAERQMVAFLPDALSYNYHYPITALKISPLQKKFSDDLSHRDFLGAVLNLGIDRGKIGDILVDEKEGILFCVTSVAGLIAEELTRVRHTTVRVEETSTENLTVTIRTERVTGTVSSLRLDSVISTALKASRSSLVSSIEGGLVFVNGRMVTSNGYTIKDGDLISVRGHGRFRFLRTISQTRKGRYLIELEKYI